MPCNNMAPLLIDEMNIEINLNGLNAKLSFSVVRVDGLDTFITREIHMGVISLRTTFDFLIPEIKAEGYYEVEGETTFPFSGSGHFVAIVRGLTMIGHAQIAVSGGFLELRQFVLVADLDSLSLQMEGLTSPGLTTEYLNAYFETFLVDLVRDNQAEITARIEGMVLPEVNAVLNEMTIQDLLDLLARESEPQEPCVP